MPALDRSLAALARERRAVLAALDAMTPAQRAFQPGPDAWSPGGIVEHLVRVERAMLAGMERELAAGDGRKELGPPSQAKILATFAAMRLPARYKVPGAAAGFVSPMGEAYEVLRAEWLALEERWVALDRTLPPALEAVALVRHPVAGPLKAADAAQFCALHAAHHRSQLDRTVRAAGFAGAAAS